MESDKIKKINSLQSQIESILFVSAKPVSFRKIMEALNIEQLQAEEAVRALQEEYNRYGRGIRIVCGDKEAEMASAPENKFAVEEMKKAEIQEELSQAAMETIAVVLYKGPIGKEEIEEIRGVNCRFILRNLLTRGLIEKEREGDSPKYTISLDLLKKLGIEKREKIN